MAEGETYYAIPAWVKVSKIVQIYPYSCNNLYACIQNSCNWISILIFMVVLEMCHAYSVSSIIS